MSRWVLAGLAGTLATLAARPVLTPAMQPVSPAVRFVPSFRAAYRAEGMVDSGDGLFEYMPNPRTSEKEIRAMLNGLSSTGQLDAAMRVLSSYLDQVVPTTSRGQSRAESRAKSKGTHGPLRTPRSPPGMAGVVVSTRRTVAARGASEERLASIVLNGCAEAGRMDLSGAVVNAMRERAVPMSELTFCILIKGYGRAGNLGAVKKLYSAMGERSVAPDLATFNALIDAHVRAGDLGGAETLLEDMRQRGVTPSPRSFNTLLNGFARAGQLRDAFHVVKRLRESLGPGARPLGAAPHSGAHSARPG